MITDDELYKLLDDLRRETWHDWETHRAISQAKQSWDELRAERDRLREALNAYMNAFEGKDWGIVKAERDRLRAENARLRAALERIIPTLELAMSISLKHEPCGYYCDEGVGHIHHKLFAWARECLGEAMALRGGE